MGLFSMHYLPSGIQVALDFVLYGKLVRPCSALYKVSVRRPETLPVGTLRSGIRLPSDSVSWRTPLPSANASYYRARSGLSPPSYRPCRAHHSKTHSTKVKCVTCFRCKYGGDEEDRTPDLCVANAALSQLSYTPMRNRKKQNRKIESA
jgi:hypothetical protein